MKQFILIILFFTNLSILFSQQLSTFTQYREYHSYLNPATVNSDYFIYEYNLNFSGSFRRQWANVEGTPTSQFLKGEYISPDHNLAMGGFIINDQTSPSGFTGVYGRLAYLITDDPYFGGLSLGIMAGVVQYRLKASSLQPLQDGDFLTMENQKKVFPDVGVGLYFYNRIDGGWFDHDTYYVGLSVPQTFGLDLNFRDESNEYTTTRIQHYYGLIGLYKYLDEGSFLEPSVWVKYVPNAPLHVDFNIRYQTANNFWIGTGLAMNGTFHVEAGFLMGENIGIEAANVKIGYGYDYSFSSFGPRFGGAHEINLSITMDSNN